ncbi:hypothetical protein BDF20DRAFT_822750 [Mycotypha africana]|uniref:uncharacterized protein n=1 Tax=Mycotypha africana TaxID=64632 RepID=UPI0023019263|nr:uncharacterized protein BDF20DRAFT_822750 [Mycotypha africana]KAI8975244.1 hypothetical protein BDF20DRAFT_822750 [Mycotypha africana]
MDWGLLQPKSQYFLLRDELVFHRWVRIQWNFFRLENEHINNCAQYRAIKEIPLPFKLTDNKHHFKTELTNDDEERISILSSSSSANKLYTNPNGNEYYQQRPAYSNASHRGSYYGRRDFENKQDDISDLRIGSFHSHHQLGRRSSTISHVLTRIKSMTDFSAEDTDAEDDDYDDEDDDECQDDSQMHNNEHF